MNKILKGKSEKGENFEMIDDAGHKNIGYSLKEEKYSITKSKALTSQVSVSKYKKVHIFIPLIMLFAIMCIIAILLIGIKINNNKSNSNIADMFSRLIVAMVGEGKEENKVEDNYNILNPGASEVSEYSISNEHICENYTVTKYDSLGHWRQCSLCEKIVGEKAEHEYTAVWNGEPNKCFSTCDYTCSCGYNYTYEVEHIEKSENYNNYEAGYIHYNLCAACEYWLDQETCTKADGTEISCSNLGTCVTCGYTYTKEQHKINLEEGKCKLCNVTFLEVSSYSATWNDTHTVFTITLIAKPKEIEGTTITMPDTMESQYSDINVTNAFSFESTGTLDNSTGYHTYQYILTLKDPSVAMYDKNEIGMRTYNLSVNGICGESKAENIALHTDFVAPVKESITVLAGGATSTDGDKEYSTKATIEALVTEGSKSVQMRLLASDQASVLTDWVSAIPEGATAEEENKIYKHVFDVIAEAKEPMTIYVQAKDYWDNIATYPVEINHLDSKGPTITSALETSSEWSKTKTFIFSATDEGVGNISIAINNTNDYVLATKSEEIYSRSYTFTEEVYGEQNVTVYFKDELGNTTTQAFKVYNIDNTPPTIEGYEIVNKEIVLTANDLNATLDAEGAGIAEYRYIGGSEENINVGEENSRITTNNKIPLSEFENVKYAYIVAIDKVGNISETLKIELPTYKIKINPNGGIWRGKTTSTELTGNNNGATVMIENPTRKGYKFIDWTVAVGAMHDTNYTFTTEDEDLTANWEINTYEITYELNGGEIEGEEGNPENYTIETDDFTLKKPTKAGYIFAGWTSEEAEIGEQNVTILKGTTGNKKYIANWAKDGYTISYELNGGVATDNPPIYTLETENFTLKKPTKAGYTFIGWTGTDIEEMTKEVTIEKGSTGNREYTANWEINTYEIIYELNGGEIEGEEENPETYTVETENFTLKKPIKAGYTFIGWTGTDIEAVMKEVTIEKGSTENREYTANWEINTYEIIYELNGGEIEGEVGNPGTYTVETENFTLKKPTKAGYTFIGWTGTDIEAEAEEVTIEKGSTGNRQYTANWEQSTNKPYTIKHWIQNLSGDVALKDENNYTLKDTELLEGAIGETVTAETKEYEGFISPEVETITFTEDQDAVLNYYYTRRTDLTCIVKHIDKETGKVMEEYVLENQKYEEEIDGNEEIKEIENYNYDSISPEVLKITTGENTINIYYVKQEGKVVVHHYLYDEEENKYTNTKLVEDEEIIGVIGENYSTTKSNEIPQNYICINEQVEGYIGEISKGIIEVNYYYKLKASMIESSIASEIITEIEEDENGNSIIKAGEEIKYNIIYETKIKDYMGKITIEIEAKLPEGIKIDLSKSNLEGGEYDKEGNTIKWITDIEDLDTFANSKNNDKILAMFAKIPVRYEFSEAAENGGYSKDGYELALNKEITIVYAEDKVLEEINLDVKGKTIQYYPEEYPEKGGQEKTTGNGKIIVHHYIQEEKTENTTLKLVPDEEITGKMGEEYKTRPSSKISASYECINEQPEGYTGIIEEIKEVRYYYRLKKPQTEGNISSEIVSGVNEEENGNWTIKVGEEAKYVVEYVIKIDDYIGNTEIKIVAKLPKGIELNKSDLAGGIYEEETNTVTWIEKIQDINTFENGVYEYLIRKEITLVYKEEITGNKEDLNLKVKGGIVTYYPEDYPEKGGQIIPNLEENPNENPDKNKGKIIVHHYIYIEEDNKYTEAKVAPDEEIEEEIGKAYETKPSDKIPANYKVVKEMPEGYKGIIEKETKEINYYYKLIKAKIEGAGKSEIITEIEKDKEGNSIIKAGKEIEYKVTYEIKIGEYIGKASIEIKAELPEGAKIDLNKSDLNEGVYDEATNTISWKKEIENIDTFANGLYTEEIIKNIKIVYAEDYVLKVANLKITGNIITYYPDNYPEKGGEAIPSIDNKPNENPEEKTGKVIVEYVDIEEPDKGAYRYEIKDVIGKEYETQEKEIPYYVLVKTTENTRGEIKEETQVVTYYYRKQDFNIGIEKTIDTITISGKNIGISNKEVAKIELKKEEIKETELIVKYNIKVTNKGELEGASKILEVMPEGYEIAYLSEEWKQNEEGELEANVNLEAGESKNLSIALKWKNKEENLGAKTNIAKIKETKNEANFKDTNKEDNIGEATVIVSIKTGEVVSTIIIVMIIASIMICSCITIITIKRRGLDLKDIKFINK